VVDGHRREHGGGERGEHGHRDDREHERDPALVAQPGGQRRGDPAAKPQTAAPAASAPKPAPVAVPKPKPAARPAKPADRVVLFAQKPVKPDAAVIRLDGRRQVVPLKTTFPAKRPTFKLVALGDGSARIGVVAGSFAGGSPTLKLRVGQKLTLQNTVDRARSTLVLVRLTTKAAAP
jgi:hypothetical protein